MICGFDASKLLAVLTRSLSVFQDTVTLLRKALDEAHPSKLTDSQTTIS